MSGSLWLLDTNILLRLVQPNSSDYAVIRQAMERLWASDSGLFYTPQNLAEFWNVCTRPPESNGYGFSVEETDKRARFIESRLTLAGESEATFREWRRIVVAHSVRGVQVHDARLVAAMYVHHVPNLLTLNVGDFRRYDNIRAMTPADVAFPVSNY